MLIDNRDERVLVLPKSTKLIGKKAKLAKVVRLIPGVNEVADDLWIEYAKHSMIKDKIARGKIVELLKETSTSKKIKEEVAIKEEELSKCKDDISEKKKLLKSKDLSKAEKEKLLKEIEEYENKEKEISLEKENMLKGISNFNKLSVKEKELIIKECYDVALLKKWRDDDKGAEITRFIDDQIKSIDSAVIQKGLKKPAQMTDRK